MSSHSEHVKRRRRVCERSDRIWKDQILPICARMLLASCGSTDLVPLLVVVSLDQVSKLNNVGCSDVKASCVSSSLTIDVLERTTQLYGSQEAISLPHRCRAPGNCTKSLALHSSLRLQMQTLRIACICTFEVSLKWVI